VIQKSISWCSSRRTYKRICLVSWDEYENNGSTSWVSQNKLISNEYEQINSSKEEKSSNSDIIDICSDGIIVCTDGYKALSFLDMVLNSIEKNYRRVFTYIFQGFVFLLRIVGCHMFWILCHFLASRMYGM
jgi:hypothetical protein